MSRLPEQSAKFFRRFILHARRQCHRKYYCTKLGLGRPIIYIAFSYVLKKEDEQMTNLAISLKF